MSSSYLVLSLRPILDHPIHVQAFCSPWSSITETPEDHTDPVQPGTNTSIRNINLVNGNYLILVEIYFLSIELLHSDW